MAGITRVGMDSAGGTILGGGNSTVRVDGALVAVVGDAVAGHGLEPHTSPVMATGSASVFIGGIAVCRQGDVATCGHAATGSATVHVNS